MNTKMFLKEKGAFTSILTGLLFICSAAGAQPFLDKPDKKFGFFIGANTSNMNFNKGYPVSPVKIAASWKAGLTVGFLATIPLNDALSIQPEYFYTQRNGSDKSNGTSYSLSYVSIPLLLNFQALPSLSIVAGPQAELMISANADKNGSTTSITHALEERSIAVTGGVQYLLGERFILSLRYLQGFNHIGIRTAGDTKEFKYESVVAFAGIRF